MWNLPAFHASKAIILCEALIDALTFWCAGYHNVTASYGVDGFTVDHLAAFQQHGIQKVLIAYDADAAGDKGAQKLAAQLLPLGIACYRVHFPNGMDANEYALKTPPAEKSLGLVLKAATDMGEDRPGSSVQRPASPEVPPPSTAAAPVLLRESEDEASITPSEPPLSLVAEHVDTVPPPVELHTSPVPSLTPNAPLPTPLSAEVKAEEVIFTLGDRRYRIRGLQKNLSYDQLRINLFAARDDAFFVDILALYHARQRHQFIKQVANELALSEDTIKKDVGKVLLQLEALHDQQIHAALAPKESEVTLTDEERTAALELLHDPHLLDRILTDFQRCGVVGEETNKLVGYLAAVSRLLDKPLAVLIQSSSAAGKTALMDAILACLPEEAKVKYSALTGQALFYLGEKDLKHKILALVEEEGAARAAYALKLLQSEGELTIASMGKDPQSGKLVTHEYRVQGPVMILLTTTAVELDDELQNRCLTLAVSEDREQTRAIHRLQREQQTLDGLFAKQSRQHVLAVHRNAHRLLRPLGVINPYARQLTFLDTATRTRRDHEKYLTLIASIALLHQYQRPLLTQTRDGQTVQSIEVTREDITVANRLAHDVLGRSLDELAPQTRRLLGLIYQMVTEQCQQQEIDRADFRFSRKEVRDYTGWNVTQTRVHLDRLVDLEYALVHRGQRGQSFVYELLYNGEGQEGHGFLMGLLDPEQLPSPTTAASWRGAEGELAGPWRPQDGPMTGVWRRSEMPLASTNGAGSSDTSAETVETAYTEHSPSVLSYVSTDGVPPPEGRD